MDDPRPTVVTPADGTSAPPTPGMDRRHLFERGDIWAGWVRTDAGVAGGWHHHGDRDSYIYLTRGSMTIDYGPGGREQVTAHAGDFIFNPARIVHRETTGIDEDAEGFLVRVGPGPHVVNVDAPDPD